MKLIDDPKMDIEDLKENYISNGKLICSQCFTDTTPQILPIAYVQNGVFYNFTNENKIIKYGSVFKKSKFDIENSTETLLEHFIVDELFYVNKFFNNRSSFPNEELYFAYGNETFSVEQEVLEIFYGEFDIDTDYFIPKESEFLDLIIEKNNRGARIYFYIRNEDDIYGPFSTDNIVGHKIKLLSVHMNNDSVFKWGNHDFSEKNKSILEFEYKTSKGNYVTRLLSAGWLDEENATEKIKFLFDDKLLIWLKKKINIKESFTKNEFKTFSEIFKTFQKANIESNEKELYTRAIRLLNESNGNIENAEEIIELLPNTKKLINGIDVIKQDANRLDDENQMLEKTLANLIIDIDNKKGELEQENNKINDLKSQFEQTESDQIIKAKEENKRLREFFEENETLIKEIDSIKIYKNLNSLKDEINEKEAELRIIRRNTDELTSTLKGLSLEFIDTQKDAQEKLRDLVKSKTHFDFISGRDFNEDNSQSEQKFTIEKISSYTDIKLDDTSFISHQKYLLDDISKLLKSVGRNYKSDFIANVLISIFQNTMTVFAGLPGTGKTSFARIISKIFVSNDKKRIEIPVAKGWSSQKDFIGFYNPLSKKFIPTNKNMYDLLNLSHYECVNSCYMDSNISMVILDEANLSPIEHYWSSFYNLTDSIATEKSFLEINIGMNECINFPNNIRFLGTINVDQTTEELSPRIIDRTNIVRIPFDDEYRISISNPIDELKSIKFTFENAIKLFNLKDFPAAESGSDIFEKESYRQIREEYNNIKKYFKDLNIIISPRIDLAFATYFNTAINFMPQYKALDYFICQRMLTKVDGQGEDYGSSLKSLKSEFESMFTKQRVTDSDSVKLITDIISVGSRDEYYHNYNYFLVN